jgi:hypothetical protein
MKTLVTLTLLLFPSLGFAHSEIKPLMQGYFDFESDAFTWVEENAREPRHPWEQRSQFWLNLLHERLKELDMLPENLPENPPRIIFRRRPGVNGEVRPVKYCYVFNSDIVLDPETGAPKYDYYWGVNDGGFLTAIDGLSCQMNEEVRDLEFQAEILEALKKRSLCEFENEEVGYIYQPSTGCQKSQWLSENTQVGLGKGVLFQRTYPGIFITAGAIPLLPSEKAFVNILAHEAAHYYLAHNSRPSAHAARRYGWYNASEREAFSQDHDLIKGQEEDFGFAQLSQVFEKALEGEQESILLIEQAAEINLSRYTKEIEADELAVLFMILLGAEPSDLLEGTNRHTSLRLDDNRNPFDLNRENCLGVTEDGNWPPFGDYGEKHGSPCFRYRNHIHHVQSLVESLSDLESEIPLMSREQWSQFQRL